MPCPFADWMLYCAAWSSLVVVDRGFRWNFFSLATVGSGGGSPGKSAIVEHLRLVWPDAIFSNECSIYDARPNDDHEIGSLPHLLSCINKYPIIGNFWIPGIPFSVNSGQVLSNTADDCSIAASHLYVCGRGSGRDDWHCGIGSRLCGRLSGLR